MTQAPAVYKNNAISKNDWISMYIFRFTEE